MQSIISQIQSSDLNQNSNLNNFLKNVHLVFSMTFRILELLTLPHCSITCVSSCPKYNTEIPKTTDITRDMTSSRESIHNHSQHIPNIDWVATIRMVWGEILITKSYFGVWNCFPIRIELFPICFRKTCKRCSADL